MCRVEDEQEGPKNCRTPQVRGHHYLKFDVSDVLTERAGREIGRNPVESSVSGSNTIQL